VTTSHTPDPFPQSRRDSKPVRQSERFANQLGDVKRGDRRWHTRGLQCAESANLPLKSALESLPGLSNLGQRRLLIPQRQLE